jgi:hypothetical protein
MTCKLCGHVVNVAQTDGGNLIATAQLVQHVQTRHPKQAFEAVNLIAPYLAMWFFSSLDEEQAKQTRQALLKGFAEEVKARVEKWRK